MKLELLQDMKVNDRCPKCKKGFLQNYPLLGTDFLMCNIDGCGYKVYSTEKTEENIEERFRLFMMNPQKIPKG